MTKQCTFAALVLSILLAVSFVAGPPAANATDDVVPETISGVVTKIDPVQSRVTVESSDGRPHEFEASSETLKELKVGDSIEVKRRPPPQ